MRFQVTQVMDAIEQRLTTDVTAAQAVVDLGEIVRNVDSDGGRPVNLVRIGMVVDALSRYLVDGGAMLYGVADRGLLSEPALTSKERMVLGRWADDGVIEVTGQVGDRPAEVADLTGLPLISLRPHPELAGRYEWLDDPARLLRLSHRQGVGALAPMDAAEVAGPAAGAGRSSPAGQADGRAIGRATVLPPKVLPSKALPTRGAPRPAARRAGPAGDQPAAAGPGGSPAPTGVGSAAGRSGPEPAASAPDGSGASGGGPVAATGNGAVAGAAATVVSRGQAEPATGRAGAAAEPTTAGRTATAVAETSAAAGGGGATVMVEDDPTGGTRAAGTGPARPDGEGPALPVPGSSTTSTAANAETALAEPGTAADGTAGPADAGAADAGAADAGAADAGASDAPAGAGAQPSARDQSPVPGPRLPVPLELFGGRASARTARILVSRHRFQRVEPTGKRAELLRRQWRCESFGCPVFGEDRRIGQSVPRILGGVPVCPRHGQPVTDIGPRAPAYPVSVVVDDLPRRRLVVRSGQPVSVGRAEDDPDVVSVAQWLHQAARAWVGLVHLRLVAGGSGLIVTDLSENGTVVWRRQGPTDPGSARLLRGETCPLGEWDSVELYTGIELVRGDRRRPVALGRDQLTSVLIDAPTAAHHQVRAS